jgi:hypothetical protein
MNALKKYKSDKSYFISLDMNPFYVPNNGLYMSRTYGFSTNNDREIENVYFILRDSFRKRMTIRRITIFKFDPLYKNDTYYKKLAEMYCTNIRSMRALIKAIDILMTDTLLRSV